MQAESIAASVAEREKETQWVDLGSECEARLGRPSARTAAIGLHFGVPLYGSRSTIVDPTRVPLRPGTIVMLLGPSGSGKSSALARIDRQFAGACHVQRVNFSRDAAIIDGVAPGAALGEAIGTLTACGLSEPRLWLRRYGELSDGECFRARLARAIALQRRGGSVAPLLCDEYSVGLHRRVARAVSFNLRKLAMHHRLRVVVACCHDDVISDLQPDVVVRLTGCGPCTVESRRVPHRRPFSLRRRLRIVPGCKRDYRDFAAMHYRRTDELGFVDKVFVLQDRRRDEPLGIVVYCHSPLELALRNRVTSGRFSGNARLLNRSFRILRRLIVHTDVRGCGLGHYLVRRTLPQVGTPYVECLAAMGEFNPVFERAGMTRVGQTALSPMRHRALERLKAMDVDPNGRAFELQVSRRPRVRALVAGVVHDWYEATTGGGAARVRRQSPQMLARTFRGLIATRPVYYLWQRR